MREVLKSLDLTVEPAGKEQDVMSADHWKH